MASQPAGLQDLKARMKATWMAGNFGKIADFNRQGAEEFVSRLNLKPGMKVLDIACGTGNQAIPAARTGAAVTGLDLAPNLLEQAKARAAEEKLSLELIEGDAEELPFPDESFDIVYSMFGAMFAPRPERVAAEMKRVCKPGGLIAMGNWTPESLPGQMFRASAKYAPPPPGVQPPVLWGVDQVVRERFGQGVQVETGKQINYGDFGDLSPKESVAVFRDFFGPVKMTFARLDPEAQHHFIADMERLFTEHNVKQHGTAHRMEFLEVHARKVA